MMQRTYVVNSVCDEKGHALGNRDAARAPGRVAVGSGGGQEAAEGKADCNGEHYCNKSNNFKIAVEERYA